MLFDNDQSGFSLVRGSCTDNNSAEAMYELRLRAKQKNQNMLIVFVDMGAAIFVFVWFELNRKDLDFSLNVDVLTCFWGCTVATEYKELPYHIIR